MSAFFALERVSTVLKIPVTPVTISFQGNSLGIAFEMSSILPAGREGSVTTSGPLRMARLGPPLGLQFTTRILDEWSRAQLVENWPEMVRLLRAGPPSFHGEPLRAPPVGGVYLDGVARHIGRMSELKAACYDAVLGRVLLIGSGSTRTTTGVAHLDAGLLATAARNILVDRKGEAPGVSIDPDPSNPRGPTMKVRYLGGIEDTSFGRILFEADRVMKSLSLGRDTLSRAPANCAAPDFHNLLELGLSDLGEKSQNELWSRFWLVPHEIVMSVTEDRTGMRFEEARLRVNTETMRWDGSQLVSAGGIKDEPAEYFAAHFTARYDAIAKEYPVFFQLRELAKIVALFRWIRKAGLPSLGLSGLTELEGRDPTVRQTASLSVEDSRSWKDDSEAINTRKLSIFGGVDLTVEDAFVKDIGHTAPLVSRVLAEGVDRAFEPGWNHAEDQLVIAALPARPMTVPGAVEYHDPGSWPDDLAWAPGCDRIHSSQRAGTGSLGPGWVLALPSLESRNPQEEDGVQERLLWVEGRENEKVPERHYTFRSPTGGVVAEFRNHFVDPSLARIAYRAEAGRAARVYPRVDGMVELRCDSRVTLVFEERTGRILEAHRSEEKIIYRWSGDRLTRMSISGQGRPDREIALGYDPAGRITRLEGSEGIETYHFGGDGRLSEVHRPSGRVSYTYDERGRLRTVASGGAAPMSFRFDEIGRIAQLTPAGGPPREVAYRVSGGRTSIDTTLDEGELLVSEFDADGWLDSQRSTKGSVKTTFQYEGQHQARIQGTGLEEAMVQFDPELRRLSVASRASLQSRVQLDELGRPDLQQLATGTWTWSHEPDGTVSRVTWQPVEGDGRFPGPVTARTGTESGGRVVEYLESGDANFALMSDSGVIRELRYQEKVLLFTPGSDGRGAELVLPDGKVIEIGTGAQ